jgi:hypothetical protein
LDGLTAVGSPYSIAVGCPESRDKMDYENVKTFKELAEAIQDQIESHKCNANEAEKLRAEGVSYISPGALINFYDATDACITFIRLKAESKRDDLPKEIPTNLIDLLNLCSYAARHKTEPKADAATENNKELSMAKMVRIYIDQNLKITLPDCKKKVNAALKLQGRIVKPHSIRNAFYDYKKHLKIKGI